MPASLLKIVKYMKISTDNKRMSTKQAITTGICVCYLHHGFIISLSFTVFTATISQSALLKVDVVNRALYTMPNSPAMNINFGPEVEELKCDWRGVRRLA